MKKALITLTLLFFYTLLSAQNDDNLNFEIIENKEAKGWSVFSNSDVYTVAYDSVVKQKGKVSGSILGKGTKDDYKALSYSIPADFGGKKIKLTGYLKTENVKEGWAGLWLRIDPEVGFDNMESKEIEGTNDWKKYEIELELASKAETIVFGGLLVGSGKIWVDNFTLTVDGKPLDQAPAKELNKAQKDKTFNNGSNITFGSLGSNQIENLELLGRIWGFLKYYHPEIGKGNFNWDYELFKILPTFQNAKTNSERDTILISWINSLGDLKPCNTCKEINEDAVLQPDLDWIEENNLSKNLRDKLRFIQTNRHQGSHYYIRMIRGVDNPEFKNENTYSDMPFPDAGFRLLAVYKYWNMIHYFSPYKHLTDKDWNSTLKEYIPQFINAKDELEYELAALKIIGDVKDTHANLWGGKNKILEQRGENRPTFHLKFIENKLVIDDFYNEDTPQNDLKIGDIITHINGQLVEDIVEEKQAFYPASNQPTRLRDISFDILGSPNKTLDLKIMRNKKTFNKTIDLYNPEDIKGYYKWYKAEKGRSFRKLEDNTIGYITLNNIKNKDVKNIRKELINTKGIIVDIRNYPSAFVPFTLGAFFTSKTVPFVKFTNGNINYPGEFTFGETLSIRSKGETYKGKVVVLVNEVSQSSAEYTAMAFRAGDNVTIIGSTTAGADGNISKINLPGGLTTMISGIGVYYPDGTETQRIGIVPDIEVKPTIKGIQEGRDELMEKAIEIISSKKID